MRILGIDPGTSCGFAVLEDGKRVASGVWDLSPKRFEGGGMRYLRFERLFSEALPGVQLVAFEEVRHHAGTTAAHVYGGIVAVLQTVCEKDALKYYAIPVATVKKTATGKGGAGKPAMVEAANKKWLLGLTEADDDEADALWIAQTAHEQFGG